MTSANSGRLVKTVVAITVAALLAFSAGCGGGGHPRGQFTGYVMDKTEEEVSSKVGKPDAVDSTSASIVKWTYKNKTFDPDNNNQSDRETILILSRDAAGKLKVTDVTYNN